MSNPTLQTIADTSGARRPGVPRAGTVRRSEAGIEARRSPLASIELLRFFSALGIVWFHLRAPGGRVAYSGLPLFVIVSAYFTIGTAGRGDWTQFWTGRLQRLALPWIAWSAFYLALDFYRYGGLSPDSHLVTLGQSLLIGGSLHLWFLPFLLLVSGPVRLAARRIGSGNDTLWLTLACLPLALGALYAHSRVLFPAPFAQWSMALPAVCYGVIAAEGWRWDMRGVSALFLAALAATAFATSSTDGLLQLAIAAAAFELALRLDLGPRLPLGIDLLALGRLSFGIYLIHPFCILIYFKFLPADGHSLGEVFAVFLMAACFTAVMQRLPGLRRLV